MRNAGSSDEMVIILEMIFEEMEKKSPGPDVACKDIGSRTLHL